MKKIIFFVCFITTNTLLAQEYFQQEVNYKINVELDDINHTLIGNIEIEYTNNSNDDLEFIWFHLWPNAYKDKTSALSKQLLENGDKSLYYAKEEEKGRIDGLKFKINNKIVRWDYHPEHQDICKIILKNPLTKGNSIIISTPFHVKIPHAKFSRLGHMSQSYMITQWYPKPAVYDKDGWHPMPYLDQGEFYSEFGKFDVSITLPNNYTVGATGELQTKSEITRLNKLAIITDTIKRFKNDMSFPPSDLNKKTLRFTQENVHDFAWFADKRFHVLKGEVELPNSKKKVTLWSMFTNNEAELWRNSIEYIHDAIYYYSLWNGDYKYKHCIAVDGTISAGSGMEYPNITIIGEMKNSYLLEEVIVHEVGHNWFYGMLANNERKYPWLDEGINSHNELRYMRLKYPNYNSQTHEMPSFIKKLFDLEKYTNKQMNWELGYLMNAWIAKDQPIALGSKQFTYENYFDIAYGKAAIAFDYLMSYLGEELYDKCMQEYFRKWCFKHPKPKDLQEVFESISKKDLSWFFEDLIKTTKQIDYSILKIEKKTKDLFITLKNIGDINAPIVISGIKNNESMYPLWIDGFEGEKKVRYFNGDYDYIQIDFYGDMPEIERKNNIMRVKGPLKKVEPLKLQILGSMYRTDRTQLFFIPIINYNVYNKFNYGLSIYNKFLPKGGFSYQLSPVFNSNNQNIYGRLKLEYLRYKTNNSYIKFNINAEKFLYTYQNEYLRIEPQINIKFNNKNLRSTRNTFFSTSYIHLNKQEETIGFIKSKFNFINDKTINPYNILVGGEFSKKYQKASLILNFKKDLNKNKNISIRTYLGYVNSETKKYNLKMSGWNGADDYLFSENSFSRSNKNPHKIPYHQEIFINEGGLKHTTNDSLNSSIYLITISGEYNLNDYINFYLEGGTNGKQNAYGAGFRLPILFNTLNLYMPIYNEEGNIKFDSSYKNNIRFNINLNSILNLQI